MTDATRFEMTACTLTACLPLDMISKVIKRKSLPCEKNAQNHYAAIPGLFAVLSSSHLTDTCHTPGKQRASEQKGPIEERTLFIPCVSFEHSYRELTTEEIFNPTPYLEIFNETNDAIFMRRSFLCKGQKFCSEAIGEKIEKNG